MGKLRILSGLDLCRILEQHGFQIVRQRGSHMVMQRRTDDGTVTVPVPDHGEIRIGTRPLKDLAAGARGWERTAPL